MHILFAANGRTLATGRVFTDDGRLVFSSAQEGLIRFPAKNAANDKFNVGQRSHRKIIGDHANL